MKSKKAEEYIKSHYCPPMLNGTNFISEHCAMNAAEIAEKEMQERAIEVCYDLCPNKYTHPAGIRKGWTTCSLGGRCEKDCDYMKEFILELNK